MSNTIKTLKDGDVVRKALSILHNNLVFCNTINKQYNDKFAVSGAKNGGELEIRMPNQFTVRSGATLDTQDVTEATSTFTVATQRGVDINFDSAELTLSMDDFAERILEPAMTRLAAEVENIVLTAMYKEVWNMVWTTSGTAPVYANVAAARAKLAQNLAPTTNRHMLMESISMNSVTQDVKGLFNKASEISMQMETGLVGYMAGFKFHESEMVPVHTNGSTDDTTPICNTSTGITSGSTSITTTGATGAVTVGDVFTIADVYDVNPETKEAYSHLKQFSIATALTTDTTDVFTVSEAPVTSGAKQNCSLVDAGASKALVFVATGGRGTASAKMSQNLAYHKDAFSLVTADLVMPKGVDFASRAVLDGIALRIVRQYDINNDRLPCRIDVLFGQKAVRPQWACRLTGD